MDDTRSRPQSIIWQKLKIALIIFLPLAILTNGILWIFYHQEKETTRDVIKSHAVNMTEIQRLKIGDNFRLIVSDLMFFSSYNQLQNMFEEPELHSTHLVNDFSLFSRGSKIFDQIRMLNETGMEIARINLFEEKPVIVPSEKLQFKGDRYYFKDTIGLEKGEIFVSPFDLNIERGKIEQPLKPMIRFATPAFDRKGQKRGVIIFNYLGANLIQDIKGLVIDSPGFYMLLNSDGYWIIGMDAEDEWGFMYESNKKQTLKNAMPVVWDKISESESGQFENREGLFTFTTVYPLFEGWKSSTGSGEAFGTSAEIKKAKEYYWKVVSYIPEAFLMKEAGKILNKYIYICIMIILILGIGSWFLASARIRKNEAVRELANRTEELGQANIRLQELDRLKSIFIASMSHELRTPLNSIIGFTGIILQGIAGEINEEQRKQLTMVKNSANHLLELISDIIDLSKIEAGKVELRIREFNLSDLIRKLEASSRISVAEKGLKLSVEVPDRLIVKSDERRTKQVLFNFVSNAVKFTDTGEISIKAAKRDGGVEVSVRDTGIGIKKDHMERLFKAFSRIRNEGVPFREGTGLGLYLSKKIAHLLHGEIRAESEIGKGSVFTFSLPLSMEGREV